MKMVQPTMRWRRQNAASGFTLAECLVAIPATSIMLVALYACFTLGYGMVKVAREDLRAAQIILQRMETIRLSSFDQVANPAYYPTNFTAYYDETPGATNHGTAYTVTFTATPGPTVLPPTYRANVLLVTVTATWQSGGVQRSRSMQTYVAQTGIQKYIAGN